MNELNLNNFRNYKNLHLMFESGINVICGENAQGKTNLLESIYYLCTTKSFRMAKDADLVSWGENSLSICGEYTTRYSKFSAEVSYQIPTHKKLLVNGDVQGKVSDYIGLSPVVTFTPDDLQMIKSGPNLRRRFLDILLSQASKEYCYSLSNYAKILKQRNAILKKSFKSDVKPDELEPWSIQLAFFGAKIISERLKCIDKLRDQVTKTMVLLSDGNEIISLKYDSTVKIPTELDHHDIEGLFINRLNESSKEEIIRKITLVGPHRDDIQILINNTEAKLFGSQGQQRSCVLALKMAEIDYLTTQKGESPIILLDDVLSELDSFRQKKLFQAILDCSQTFVTTTDTKIDEIIPNQVINVISVSKGEIS